MELDTLIGLGFVPDWGPAEGVRELLQNWIDVDAGGKVSWSNGTATIRDLGPGLQPKHLVLGYHEGTATSIGQFGAGLKQGLLVLARENRDVRIQSGNLEMRPYIQESAFAHIDTLHLSIEDRACYGTTITVSCSKEEYLTARAYFEAFPQSKVKWVDKKKVSSPGGWLFVNGSRVGSLPDAKYSYHLYGSECRKIVDQDRKRVDMPVACDQLSPLIGSIQDSSARLALLKAHASSIWEWDGPWLYTNKPEEIENWKASFEALFPNTVLSSNARMDTQAAYLGYHVLQVPSRMQYFLSQSVGILTAEALVRQKGKPALIPYDLSESEKKMLAWVRKLIDARYYHDTGDIHMVSNLNEYSGAIGGVTEGMLILGEIYLNPVVFESRSRLLNTVLHETVHKWSGAADCSSLFEDALCDVASGAMLAWERDTEGS